MDWSCAKCGKGIVAEVKPAHRLCPSCAGGENSKDPDGKTYWARLKEAKGKRKALREALQPAPRGEPR